MKNIRIQLIGEAEEFYKELLGAGYNSSEIFGKALKCLKIIHRGVKKTIENKSIPIKNRNANSEHEYEDVYDLLMRALTEIQETGSQQTELEIGKDEETGRLKLKEGKNPSDIQNKREAS